MRAAVVKKVGGPEAIEILEVALPEPGPLQVRIKVAAAAVNPADAAMWAGFFGPLQGMEHAGLGLEAAGTIDAVGPGVLLEVGTAVIAFDAAVLRPTKAQAEYLVVDLNSLAPAPEGMDLTLAATIPLNAVTASQALDHLPLRPLDTLLVTGAAGAVGGYAVELASTRGLRVVAQGQPDDEEFLRGRGATWFVSRQEDSSPEVACAGGSCWCREHRDRHRRHRGEGNRAGNPQRHRGHQDLRSGAGRLARNRGV
jgi:NADPH:quinone reductase-like Zn-dependent oxidoreductase